MGKEVHFCNEKVLEVGCTTHWIYLTLLNCTLRNCYSGKFYVLHFNKIKGQITS